MHCPGCTKHYGPSPSCPGCGHEDLERQLADAKQDALRVFREATASDEALQAKLAEAQAALVSFTAHGMADVRALWANGRVCDDCSHALCVFFREAIRERDALQASYDACQDYWSKEEQAWIRERNTLQATLEQARELFSEIKAQWGNDYLWEKWGLSEAIAALDAGKEAGG